MTSKERPILFSAPMVRAILDGRKTQTRRVFKRRTGITGPELDPTFRCPYGSPGDRLWVRETWGSADTMYQGHENDVPGVIAYRADRSAIDQGISRQVKIPQWDLDQWNWDCIKWRPSIHMPRWASRITLEVTDVRIERLQDITEEDARAEGITDGGCLTCGENEPCGCDNPRPDARDGFAGLWQDIYGPDSWHANPWVWVVSFRGLQP